MGSVGYGGYPDDQATTALRADAGATTMLPPMNPDDGGYGYDDRPDRRRQKKSNTSTILLVVAGVLVLVGAILIGKWIFSGGGAGNDQVAVPNLVNQPQADATRQLGNVDLKVGDVTQKACENTSKGNVCSQTPTGGTKVDKNSSVSIVVSTGAPKVAVPSVLGQDVDDATQTLEGDKYQVVVKTKQEESTEQEGKVLNQDPELGAEVEKGSTITLTIAKAEEKSTVPDVTGQSCDDAKAQMQANDLVGNCTEVDTDDTSKIGKVISTTPGPGNQVEKNSSVNIQIGRAPDKTEVPDVRGRTVAQARQILNSAGFTNIQFPNGGDQSDTALVAQQDPQAGNEVDDPGNTQINLTTVSVGNGNNNGGNNGGGFFGGGTG
jgi:serine/threonine-protein kinase